eukprot:m.133153 g.133153  ORF g.133153 m.133153 type:complete len:180 (+) comp23801_c0_seq1:743-1282(+)
MCFLEFPNAKASAAALEMHHTKLKGRRINVERSEVGGNTPRKADMIQQFREEQKQEACRKVSVILKNIRSRYPGMLAQDELDSGVMTFLQQVPENIARQAMEMLMEDKKSRTIEKTSAYLMALLRRLHDGERPGCFHCGSTEHVKSKCPIKAKTPRKGPESSNPNNIKIIPRAFKQGAD